MYVYLSSLFSSKNKRIAEQEIGIGRNLNARSLPSPHSPSRTEYSDLPAQNYHHTEHTHRQPPFPSIHVHILHKLTPLKLAASSQPFCSLLEIGEENGKIHNHLTSILQQLRTKKENPSEDMGATEPITELFTTKLAIHSCMDGVK